MKRQLACRLLSLAALSVVAGIPSSLVLGAEVPRLPAELVIRGWVKPPFIVGPVSRGQGRVRELPLASVSRREEMRAVVAEAQYVVDTNHVIGLLLLDGDGTVLFEAYKQGAGSSDSYIGYSMSKSATSIAVGQALCDGLLRGIDDPAEKYAAVLQGTAYGEASIRELLMMASAGKRPVSAGQPVSGSTTNILRKQTKTIREGFKEYGGRGDGASTRGQFEYKGFDTHALGAVLAVAAKEPFHSYFSKAVWQRIGAEADAGWLLDRNGDAAAAEGLGARLRDWGRLALYVRDHVRQPDKQDTCLGKYLKDATSTQIENKSARVGSAFNGYGYQYWSDNWMARVPSFWMAGYGGQRVGVDLVNGRVLVLISNVEDFMPDVYRLFYDLAQ